MRKNDDQQRAEILSCGLAMHNRNFCPSTSGNISVRLDAWRVLITPTGISKGKMKPEDLVVISPEGAHRYGKKNASSEKDMHLQIYRLRPDVNAVVHSHPPTATAFACAGLALDAPIASEFTMALGKVPLAAYGTPGTPDLAAGMAALIPSHSAILLGNHGVVTYGKDIADAHGKMDMVEHFAEIVLDTLKIGRQTWLSGEDLRRLNEAAKSYATLGGRRAA